MIGHQNIGMVWLDVYFIPLNLVESAFQEDANKERSPPKEKWMKWFRFNHHNNKPANLDAKFGLIIS